MGELDRVHGRNSIPATFYASDDLKDIEAFTRFLNAGKRLCSSYKLCSGCPIREEFDDCRLRFDTIEDPEHLVNLILRWENDNPAITNREKFFETFGQLSYADRRLIMVEEFGFQKWLEKEYKNPKEEANE